MKIALISDNITASTLRMEENVRQITPYNYRLVLKIWKPDILLVESAWQGYRNRWKYKIATYPDVPKRNNHVLRKVTAFAKNAGIPTVFWNKEDSIHFDRFIESAALFDHIFTVDENCIDRYRDVVEKHVTVSTLMFAVQPKIHHFTGFDFKYNRANFAGSYSHHIHDKRRMWQNLFFEAAEKRGLAITVFDRNSKRRSSNYRYPDQKNLQVLPAVSYEKTAQIYKEYALSLNVNTIEDSPTMFSRRLTEILACGGVAVTTPSLAVDRLFREYCHVVASAEEMEAIFDRVARFGLDSRDLEMARAGAAYVAEHHTWRHRIDEIKSVLGMA